MASFTEDRMQEVFEKTVRLMGEKDYSRLTMLDIAKTANISKETLYKNFGNKTGLFTAIIKNSSGSIKQPLEKMLHEQTQDVDMALTNVVFLYLSTILSETSATINRIAIAEINHSPELASILIENGRGNVFPSLCEYLSELQQQGEIDDDWETEELAEILFGLAAGDMQIRLLLRAIPATMDAGFLLKRAQRTVKLFLKMFAR